MSLTTSFKAASPIRMSDEPTGVTTVGTFDSPGTEAPTYNMALLEELGGYDVETGMAVFDPLRFASSEFGSDEAAKLQWYRSAEIKHGRVSMAATVGYLVAKFNFHFNGLISVSAGADGGPVSFADISASSTNPFEQWDAVPAFGKIQLFVLAGFIELAAEQNLIDGGMIGSIPWVKKFNWLPTNPPKDEKEAKKREASLLSELKNGRLAMIGIAGFYAAETIPGSVPLHF